MKIRNLLTLVSAVVFSVVIGQAWAHESTAHDSEFVACCIHGSVAGTPGGIQGSPTDFCENPKIKFKKNSGTIGDQLFRPVICDKYVGLQSGDDVIRPGQTHNRAGVSCHYNSRGFRIMCAREAAACENSSCGRTRKAGS